MIIIASYSNVSVTYTADGTQREFSFPFDYLRKAFVKVEVNEEIILVQGTDYTVSDNKTVVLTEAPESGTIVRVFRETSTTRLVSWADASVLRAKDMTIQQVQDLHILEEQQYWVTENAIIRQGKEWNARNFPIKNVGDPVDPKDATNKEYVDNNFMKMDDNGDYWVGRGKTIRDIEEPIRQSDGATKNYVDHVLAGLSITGDRVQTFNSVALMKEAHLEPGMVAMTTGYHNPNDGGASTYSIRDKVAGDVDDGGSVIILDNGNVAELIADNVVNVKQFGAKGDGVTNETTYFTNAINYTSKKNGELFIPEGVFLVTTIIILDGVKKISSLGLLKGIGDNVPVVSLGGGTVNDTPAQYCDIQLNIDLNEKASHGIFGTGVCNCVIHDCNIFGFPSENTHAGIYLYSDSNNNIIQNNNITMYENPNGTQIGIYIVGENIDWAGFYTGTISEPIVPCSHNTISNNIVKFGKNAVDLLATEYTIIENNQFIKQHTRAVYLALASNHSIISNNEIVGFEATAVLLGYGAHDNIISDNKIKQIANYNGVSGEAAINVICQSVNNTISNNYIDAFTNYGIYVAISSMKNVVQNNTVKDYVIAAIALESDWVRPLPSGYFSTFSRPNYGAPAEGTKWAYHDSTDNTIKGNVIYQGHMNRAGCCIYIAQVSENAKITHTTIQDNVIAFSDDQYCWPLIMEEANSGDLNKTSLINNRFKDVNINRIYLKRGRLHCSVCYGNDGIDTGTVVLSDTSNTTPSVGKGYYFNCNYTSTIGITDFLDAPEGTEILVKLNSNTQLNYSGAHLSLKDKANVTGFDDRLSVICLRKIATTWVEVSRNF